MQRALRRFSSTHIVQHSLKPKFFALGTTLTLGTIGVGAYLLNKAKNEIHALAEKNDTNDEKLSLFLAIYSYHFSMIFITV